MKESIIGYINHMLDNHERVLDNLTKFHHPQNVINEHKDIINELSDLLDFVEDIPEEKPSVINLIVNGRGIAESNQRIKELKESLKSMSEVEINLHNKIASLISENNQLKQKLGGKING